MTADRVNSRIERLSAFLQTPFDQEIDQRTAQDPEASILAFLRQTLAEVPAYRKFLAAQGIDPATIRTAADFARLPLLTKPNYMQAYPLAERVAGGELSACDRLAVSSGSTGTPTFWPRAMVHELAIALRFEQVFHDAFKASEQPTLAVVCFPLGNWVGGIFTTSCCWLLAQKGYPLTVATPGNKPDEILRVVRELGPSFGQTVLLGYPPFVKDVIDTGTAQGFDWSSQRIRLVFAGEVFSEEWRNLLCERVGAADPVCDTASLYGTADGGVLGNETPVSIAIRRFLAQRPDAARALFGESRLPTLVQYDPTSRYFECVDGTLVVSGENGVPLVRYHIADRGGLLEFDAMFNRLREFGLDGLSALGLPAAVPVRRQPFVWVFGRADFTVSFYGANVFPENVVVGLEQPGLSTRVSGKFVMETRHDAAGESGLHIVVELLPNVAGLPELAETLAASIRTQLLRLNSEFANYVPAARQTPVIELRPFGDPDYFPVGVKHRYTRRPPTA